MPKIIPDITGERFGRLVAGPKLPKTEYIHGNVTRLFTCDCGAVVKLPQSSVRCGLTTSCGCYKSEQLSLRNTKHGLCPRSGPHELYPLWQSMHSRCNNPNVDGYKYYGGLGIIVCKRWNDFATFVFDIGDRPSPEHTIHRIDGDGNYEPTNCKWATDIEQANSRHARNSLQTRQLAKL